MTSAVKNSINNLFRKGFRTVLTILAISIGVCSVVLIGAFSDSGEKAVGDELDSLGLNGLSVAFKSNEGSFSFDDAKILRSITGIDGVTPYCSVKAKLSYNDICENVSLWGTESDENKVFSTKIDYGRDFTKSEVEDGKNVCLIDKKTAKKMFGRGNVVGKTVSVIVNGNESNLKIVGVTTTDSAFLQSVAGTIVPDFAYIPYTFMSSICGDRGLSSITVTVSEGYDSKSVSREIISTMNSIKGDDTIKVDDLSSQRSKLDNIMNIVTSVLGIIGIIALFVSGLGIMTVMLVSVSERTREIGVKKAIGASFWNIFAEFLSDALTISIIGSIIGAAFGIGVCAAATVLFKTDIIMDYSRVAYSVLFAIVSGVIFGVYPAIKAAKMTPVDALRYE